MGSLMLTRGLHSIDIRTGQIPVVNTNFTNSSQWTTTTVGGLGNWVAQNATYVMSTDYSNAETYYMGNWKGSDFELRVKISTLNFGNSYEGPKAAGVIFRANDTLNWYGAVVKFDASGQNPEAWLYRRSNGIFEVLARAPLPPSISTSTHELRIVASGPKISIDVDSTVILTWRDAYRHASSGRIGLHTSYAQALFGNLTVMSVNPRADFLVISRDGQGPTGAQTMSFTAINPTQYLVHVKASSPFFLVLGETFDSSWEASIQSVGVRGHLLVNGFSNAWYISRPGDLIISLAFGPQRFAEIGSTISLTTFASVGFVWLYTKRHGKFSLFRRLRIQK
jgi:hypothetical protein